MKPAHRHERAESESVLEKRMRTEQPSFSPRAGFTERVMENLGRQEPATEQRATFPAIKLFIGFAAAACLIFLATRFLPQRQNTPDPVQTISKMRIPEISVEKVEALTAKLDEPLEIELKNVISDTRQAIQFVASNFLPEN
jgi:hypothetical protein